MRKKRISGIMNKILVCAIACLTGFAGVKTAEAAIVSDNGDGTFTNPVIFSDVPDEDIIRVDDTYYMISTTMHMSPGAPIMKSYDLVNWEICNYVYDNLEEDDVRSLKNGKSDYAYGSWAASLRYDKYQKRYYVTFSSQTSPKSYFFVTDDIENGSWIRSETEKCYDSSFLFVDTGTSCEKYMIIPIGNGTYNQTHICDLIVDEKTWEISLGAEKTMLIPNNNVEDPPIGLTAEGIHAYKIGDYYYFFMIQGGNNPVRQQICWRSKTLEYGTFEVKKVFLGGIVDENGKTINSSWGIAQGGIVETPEGEWYSIMFQDYHSVGRIPCLVPLKWDEDGWPVLGNEGKSVNQILQKPVQGYEEKSIVNSDEFDNGKTQNIYDAAKINDGITAGLTIEEIEAGVDVLENEFGYNGSNLRLEWQWNHNPNNNLWSLTDREGFLRLKSGTISANIRTARNTLTQRTYGPTSGADTVVETAGMKDGDVAGITAFQNQYGFVGVKMENGEKFIIMQRATKAGDANGQIQQEIPLSQDKIYLKVICDFREDMSITNSTWRMKDEAYFFYSLDGRTWNQIGDTLNMEYDWPDFMGYRFGLFYYSTENIGGYVDFDYFHVTDVADKKASLLKLAAKAEKMEIKSYYQEADKTELADAINEVKTVLATLPDDDSAMDLVDIEYSNETAYPAEFRLKAIMEKLKSTPEPVNSPSDNPASVPDLNPPLSNSDNSTQVQDDKKEENLNISFAGYILRKNMLNIKKGAKVKIKHIAGATYFSSDNSIATVSKNGVIKAKKAGKIKVTVKTVTGEKTFVVKVADKKKANKKLVVKPNIKIKKGGKVVINIKKLTLGTTDKVIFKSLNKKTVTVDAYGIISGKKKGSAKIRVSCGKKSAIVKVTVK